MQEWKPLLKIMMQTNEQYINKSALNECITYLYRQSYDWKVEIFIDEIFYTFPWYFIII